VKILLVNQYFWPDMAATAQLLADLAEDLVSAGHEVTALAGRGTYVADGDGPLPRRGEHAGASIRRVWCTNFGRGHASGRVLDYATYFLMAALTVLLGARQDAVVCLSTPPLVAALGLLARLRGTKFVYKVEDLYPDVALALGTFKAGSVAARVFTALSHTVLQRADVVVALDEGMARSLRERGAGRVEVIPNWADGQAIRPDREAGEAFRRKHGLEGRFVVLYSGNLGLVHRFDAVVDAARTLAKREPQVLFLFVGGGPRCAEVHDAARELPNVRFLPYQPRESLTGLFNAAEVHLVTLRDEVAGLLFPSKYAAALAAGRPVLLVGGRGTGMRAEIDREGIGWRCDHDGEAVCASVMDACRAPARRAEMGSRARSLMERKYERKLCTRRWAELLGGVVK
jgi:colanic acid biosynthesis glycosyl transferase WcaI